MLKWNDIDKSILAPEKNVILKHSDNKLEYEVIAKKVMGLKENEKLKDFKFELTVFGMLSECFFATQFYHDVGTVQEILTSGQAIPSAVAFENDAYRDELLNLFNKEDEQKPDLSMLKDFIKSKVKAFQVVNGQDETFWIAEWSDVNCWACYWRSGDKFNCVGKMSS